MSRDWILVRGGTPEAIRRAVTRYAGLFAHKVPSVHRVVVYRLDGDRHPVRFDPPLPPYAFTNLINWLDDPHMSKGAGGAVGWFTSPGTGVRYFLAPKRPNTGGDTLVGVSDAGEEVEVFLPDCGLRPARNNITPMTEPAVLFPELSPVAEFEVEVDSHRSFGNPDFVTG